MGRATTLRKQRQMQRLFAGAFALEAHQAKKPCHTCAFSDPEAWVADPEMGHKVLRAITHPVGHKFFCHEGLAQGGKTGTTYQVPAKEDGSPDIAQLVPCGGFLRWAVPYRFAAYITKFKAVMALQLRMCRRYLSGNFEHSASFRVSCGGKAAVLQGALNMQTMTEAGEDD